MRNVVVYGATSAIAQEAVRCFAKDGDRLFLIGRNHEKLATVAEDAAARGATLVETRAADLADTTGHGALYADAKAALGSVDVVVVAHGVLGSQEESQRDFHKAAEVLQTNFLSVVSLLTPVANDLEEQRRGTIVVISSVAGDRGRQSNYVYGAAKGGLATFLQGLRNRLHKSGVRVVTVKPGFVSTPMTAHLEQGALFADPKDVGYGIYRAALGKGPDEVYLPRWWGAIMGVIRMIPEPVFKRLKL